MYRCVMSLRPVMTQRAAAMLPKSTPCFFMTDIEGNDHYFRSMLQKYHESKQLTPSLKLIVGGDIQKAGQDIAIAEALMQIKAESPETVLLAGNRDIQLLHFTTYLKATREQILESMMHEPPAFWAKRHSLPHYLCDKLKITSSELESKLRSMSLEMLETIHCQFKLQCQMGSPISFVARKHELAHRLGKDAYKVSNEEVLQSFIDLISPHGVMRRYLLNAKLAHIEQDVLFIHGALTPESLGYIPERGHTGLALHEWVEQLNAWYINHVSAQFALADDALVLDLPKFDTMAQYLIHNRCSIVTSNWYDHRNKLAPVSSSVRDYLKKAGITCVVTGHQPVGNGVYPLVIRDEDLTVVIADTTYSGLGTTNMDIDTRGGYYSPFIIAPGQHMLMETYHHDQLLDRRHLEFADSQNPIGRFIDNDLLIQRQLEDGHYGAVQLDGFKLKEDKIKHQDIKSFFDVRPGPR